MTKIAHGSRDRCPRCLTTVQFLADSEVGQQSIWLRGSSHVVQLDACQCPQCGMLVLVVQEYDRDPNTAQRQKKGARRIILPRGSSRPPVPPEVPPEVASDFNEAAQVLEISSKASAALSRRVLQAVLTGAGGAVGRDLSAQIDSVMEKLPSPLASAIDAVRVIGNFAAHPIKSQATDCIVDVEVGEAELLLDVLESLFDHYYVQPVVLKQKLESVNDKLKAAGKPGLKMPSQPNNRAPEKR